MRYTEEQLKNFCYPLSGAEQEKCLEAMAVLLGEIRSLGYQSRATIRGGRGGAADYSCELLGRGRLLVQLLGSYAANTNADRSSRLTVLLQSENKILAEELYTGLCGRLNPSVSTQGNSLLLEGLTSKSLRVLIGYDQDGGTMLVGEKPELVFPLQNLQELQRKSRATDYQFCKLVRIFKNILQEMELKGKASAICPVKLEYLLAALPDDDYRRFDTLSEKLLFVQLQAEAALENEDDLQEPNGRKSLFPTEENRQKYLCYLQQLRNWLQD